ncbi:inter alpha-trypsin inhibitor, heavy chain 4-like isoform X2 [Periplaneta americana]|uniref:inter alpha-trypsin inhibitor, heavy chain 4-like isoform X2 n=1 Tax=Periplaneta americana TaxID=6978 RepID=UPI0037E7513E
MCDVLRVLTRELHSEDAERLIDTQKASIQFAVSYATMQLSLLFLVALHLRTITSLPQSFIASSTPLLDHAVYYGDDIASTTQAPPKLPKPEMYSLRVESRIKSRYARTVVSSRLANPANKSQEVFFSVVLPETAFISGFLMEVDGKAYEAYVREKEEAKHEYEQAVSSGQTAAHVALSARDSNRFTVSVNVEPQKKVTFNLTYEELLTRRLGEYNHVINLHPGQEVRDLQVDVYISESRNITSLRVPELRSGNEIDPEQDKKVNALAKIERSSSTEAHIHFSPTIEQQRELATKMRDKDGDEKEEAGLSGQFVVQYDVDRDPQAGEVLVNEGYFVHFFSPTDLKPLRKHAVFVLDVSGSMDGRKIEQLKEAMETILDDLNDGDYFNIVEFSYSVTVWNLDSTSQSAVFSPYNAYGDSPKPHPGPTPAFPATQEYKTKAKDIIKKMRAGGGTNIHDTLKTAIQVAHEGLQNITTDDRPEPIIVFLTDGEPTVGEVRPNKIQSAVRELNTDPQASIFSLALGDDADLGFLKKLSLRNSGFARKIYEASDTALQLTDFYRQVASPLLANVTFSYQPDQVEEQSTTRRVFPTLFSGSELVVAGKIKKQALQDTLLGQVSGSSLDGASSFRSSGIVKSSSLERLWAYLTIQQLIEQHELQDEANSTESKKKALQMALKYSFVTPVTSLVVVKPNDTHAVGSEVIQPAGLGSAFAGGLAGGFHPARPIGAIGGPAGLPGQPGYPGFPPQPLPTFPSSPPIYLTTRLEGRPTEVTTETYEEGELMEKLPIDELVWLNGVRNGTDNILLPLGENGTAKIYRLGENETAVEGVKCTSGNSQEEEVCVPLPQCVLRAFSQDMDTYLKQYFCAIDSLAGVCCPGRLQSQKTATTENSYDTTTAVDQVPNN